MGTHDGTPTGFVIQHLLDRPQAFNLFQAISLLEAELIRMGHGAEGECIRFRSHVSLAFEPSDIRAVTVEGADDPAFTLWTSVLSLAGATGPLPTAYTEMLLARAAKRDHAMAEFLDIFNQRFLYFLYGSRRKHHAALGSRPQESAVASVLTAVGSLGRDEQAPARRAPLWLRHAGLLGGAPRSMTGLLALLRDRVALHISGRQFVGQWLPIEANGMARLGTSQALNGSAVLGRKVWDQAAGIALDIAVDNVQQLHSCLPGGSAYQQLKMLIQAYVRQELSVTLVLQLRSPCQSPTRLGAGQGLRLGWSAWLPTTKTAPPPAVQLRLALCDFD